MDFTISEEQQELAGLAARILGDRMDLQHLKERDRSDDWYDLDTWREFAKANLLGVALPESAGGLGLGFTDLCMVLQEVGRNVAPLPFIPTLVSAAMPIARYGTEFYMETARLLMEVMQDQAPISGSSPGAVVRGRVERMLRGMHVLTFGGGTNEMQRDLISIFGLNMPGSPR